MLKNTFKNQRTSTPSDQRERRTRTADGGRRRTAEQGYQAYQEYQEYQVVVVLLSTNKTEKQNMYIRNQMVVSTNECRYADRMKTKASGHFTIKFSPGPDDRKHR